MDNIVNNTPTVLTEKEIGCSCCELGDIKPDRIEDYDIVVVGEAA